MNISRLQALSESGDLEARKQLHKERSRRGNFPFNFLGVCQNQIRVSDKPHRAYGDSYLYHLRPKHTQEIYCGDGYTYAGRGSGIIEMLQLMQYGFNMQYDSLFDYGDGCLSDCYPLIQR